MKIIAAIALAAANASSLVQVQGTRDDGTPYSATRSKTAVAYQEAGESFVATAGTVGNEGKGMHTLCYTNGPDAGKCKTEEIVYVTYNWDPVQQKVSSTGEDALGEFTYEGTVQGDKTVLNKVWTSGNGGLLGLTATINMHSVPDETGLAYGNFDFLTNKGVTGNGRFAYGFTENVQTSFDDDSLADA